MCVCINIHTHIYAPLARPCLPVASLTSFLNTWKPQYRCSTDRAALKRQGSSWIWEPSPSPSGKAGPAQVGISVCSAALSFSLVISGHQTIAPWVTFSTVLVKLWMGILWAAPFWRNTFAFLGEGGDGGLEVALSSPSLAPEMSWGWVKSSWKPIQVPKAPNVATVVRKSILNRIKSHHNASRESAHAPCSFLTLPGLYER